MERKTKLQPPRVLKIGFRGGSTVDKPNNGTRLQSYAAKHIKFSAGIQEVKKPQSSSVAIAVPLRLIKIHSL